MLRMSYCDHLLSVIRRRPSVIRPSTPLNNFSSVTPVPIFFKLHVDPFVEGGCKFVRMVTVC